MLLYVFIVAVANLCLGYALAVYVAPRLGLLPPPPKTNSSRPPDLTGPTEDPA
jgi:hypothetical protein